MTEFAWAIVGPGKPPPRAVPDLDALLRDSSIDGVYVAAPHSSHDAFIRATPPRS
jgi:predicted dehydrogenase